MILQFLLLINICFGGNDTKPRRFLCNDEDKNKLIYQIKGPVENGYCTLNDNNIVTNVQHVGRQIGILEGDKLIKINGSDYEIKENLEKYADTLNLRRQLYTVQFCRDISHHDETNTINATNSKKSIYVLDENIQSSFNMSFSDLYKIDKTYNDSSESLIRDSIDSAEVEEIGDKVTIQNKLDKYMFACQELKDENKILQNNYNVALDNQTAAYQVKMSNLENQLENKCLILEAKKDMDNFNNLKLAKFQSDQQQKLDQVKNQMRVLKEQLESSENKYAETDHQLQINEIEATSKFDNLLVIKEKYEAGLEEINYAENLIYEYGELDQEYKRIQNELNEKNNILDLLMEKENYQNQQKDDLIATNDASDSFKDFNDNQKIDDNQKITKSVSELTTLKTTSLPLTRK